MLRRWMRELKNQMEPPGGFNSPPLQLLSWKDCEMFCASSLWLFQSLFLPFPISGSNHKPFSHCQQFPCEMVWRWWCCWVFALGVVVLGSVSAGCQVVMAELRNFLALTWGDLFSCAKRESDKYYSVLSFLLPQLCSCSGLCALQGALLPSWWNQSWYSLQRFSYG